MVVRNGTQTGLLLAVVLAFTGAAWASLQPKGAVINLRAPWDATSYLLEAHEFVSDEDPDLFWTLAEAWLAPAGPQPEAAKGCWERIVSSACAALPPNTALCDALRGSLAGREYTARLEAARSLSPAPAGTTAPCCWAVVNGGTSETAEDLTSALAGVGAVGPESPPVQPRDHTHPRSSTDGPTVLVHGAPGTACFAALHGAVIDALEAGQELRYVVRPVLGGGCPEAAAESVACVALGTGEGGLSLPGFGVELSIKNMEYSAVDDAEKKQQRDAGVGGDEDMGEVNGFVFETLMSRRPDLKGELMTFRDVLLSARLTEKLDIWDIQDIGVQAAQRIIQASDPLRVAMDVSQGFPSLASSLSKLAVQPAVQEEIAYNQGMIPAGANVMLINGMGVEVAQVDLLDLQAVLRREARIIGQMAATGLPLSLRAALLGLRAMDTSGAGDARVDLRSSDNLIWMNDIETDPNFADLSSSFDVLLHTRGMMGGGGFPPIRRNAFNVITIIDPASEGGIAIAQYMQQLADSAQVPLRFGVIFIVPSVLLRAAAAKAEGHDFQPNEIVWADMTDSERVLRAVFAAKTAGGKEAGTALWDDILLWWQGAPLHQLEEGIQEAFQDKWPEGGACGVEDGATAYSKLKAKELCAEDVSQMLVDYVDYVSRKGIGDLMLPYLSFNGLMLGSVPHADVFPDMLMQSMDKEIDDLAKLAAERKLKGKKDAFAQILKATDAVKRYNPAVVEGKDDESGMSISQVVLPRGPSLPDSLVESDRAALATLGVRSSVPGYWATGATTKAITHLVFADPCRSAADLDLVRAALGATTGSVAKHARLAVLNPAGAARPTAADALLVALTVEASANGDAAEALRKSASSIFRDSSLVGALCATEASGDGGAVKAVDDALGLVQEEMELEVVLAVEQHLASGIASPEPLAALLRAQAAFARSIKLGAGEVATITNGRMIRMSNDAPLPIVQEDFALMNGVAYRAQSARHLRDVVNAALEGGGDVDADEAADVDAADAVAAAASVLAATASSGGSHLLEQSRVLQAAVGKLGKEHSAAIVKPRDEDEAALDIQVLLDPVSTVAQRLTPLLVWIRELFNARIELYLNPKRGLNEVPLKTYYAVGLPKLADDAPEPPAATFRGLPSQQVLSMQMQLPEGWVVSPVRALHDIDNLKLADLGAAHTMYADFELETIMIQGSAVVEGGGGDPRGTQLVVGNATRPYVADTLVMSNVGYFQLKAAPGLWRLSLADGPSRTAFRILSATDYGTSAKTARTVPASDPSSVPVMVDSLDGKVIVLRLSPQPGYEGADVLDLDGKGAAALDDAFYYDYEEGDEDEYDDDDDPHDHRADAESHRADEADGGVEKADGGGAGGDDDVVNIFTIASGHMYERLQKIMFLSVLKNTHRRVKFWIIKNYMSPQMKAFIPHMAEEYGFDYELVTYKWPSWLHKQSEKQRIIWAYKILFLDVLFPLHVRRVIFVDADQVVRADVGELMDMNLQGAPLAYTPFCDNNKAMDGYRFWNQGFWMNHLQGKPYHISALYVVDVERFRQMAAGDSYRVVYDQLSKDPNSLANLDQDLPNYMQHQVPIFSLPQEWLWCESWCGEGTKAAAKTIDLCNNPQTKEPKLSAARRIVAEWPALDEEARAFTEKVETMLRASAVDAEDVVSLSMNSGNQEKLLTEKLPGHDEL